jgi:predicted nucleic acid-binding protein
VPLLFWDASALAKRFAREQGSDTVDALLDPALPPDQSTTAWGYAETYSVLLRRRNDGRIDFPAFLAAVAALQAEVVDSGRFHFLPIDEATIFASPLIMQQHNLNSTDAAILTRLLDVLPSLPPGDALVLVAADTRLLRGAAAEGLATLNPETVDATDVPALLAAL